jgi:hypothetical protein
MITLMNQESEENLLERLPSWFWRLSPERTGYRIGFRNGRKYTYQGSCLFPHKEASLVAKTAKRAELEIAAHIASEPLETKRKR